jgi:hypothetical protein
MARNPMPRMKNPDPNGFLMKMAENRVESEVQDKPSIAQLLDRNGIVKSEPVKTEERQGEKTVTTEETNTSPGKTLS